MQTYDEEYIRLMGKMERPIPGQSLTNDPDNPLPFEGPPTFTKKKDALEYIFTQMTKPENYSQVMEMLAQGGPVTDISQTILMKGFQEGKWNPDMFLMLLEPTMYMTMALAERADIDYTIDGGPADPAAVEDSELAKRVETVKKGLQKSQVKPGVLPKEIEQKIKEAPVTKPEPLIARPTRPSEVKESLIKRPIE
jgi:hypothetical protein